MTTPPVKPDDRCPTCKQKIPHPRNQARHNLLFAVLVPAFRHWPETHEFKPEDTEHLRAYLLAKAQHCTYSEIDIGDGTLPQITAGMAAFMNALPAAERGRPIFFRQTKTGIRGYRAKSISYTKCSEESFKKVLDSVIEIIETTIGVKVEKLKAEASKEA
jgi:hypothetical protein